MQYISEIYPIITFWLSIFLPITYYAIRIERRLTRLETKIDFFNRKK